MRKRGMIVLSLMIAFIIMLVPVASLRARAEEGQEYTYTAEKSTYDFTTGINGNLQVTVDAPEGSVTDVLIDGVDTEGLWSSRMMFRLYHVKPQYLAYYPLPLDKSDADALIPKHSVSVKLDPKITANGVPADNANILLNDDELDTLVEGNAPYPVSAKNTELWKLYEDSGFEEIERFAFYERAKNAYAVIATGEERQYANLLLVKGVVVPEEEKNNGALLRGAEYYRNL